MSSAIIIYGISIAYGITGSTNIGDVIQGFATLDAEMLPLGLLAIGMFIAGFGFKMGLVPFHMWLPDTYEGAPPPITALLAAGTKKAGFAAALRVIIIGTVALNLDWNTCSRYYCSHDYDYRKHSSHITEKSCTNACLFQHRPCGIHPDRNFSCSILWNGLTSFIIPYT